MLRHSSRIKPILPSGPNGRRWHRFHSKPFCHDGFRYGLNLKRLFPYISSFMSSAKAGLPVDLGKTYIPWCHDWCWIGVSNSSYCHNISKGDPAIKR